MFSQGSGGSSPLIRTNFLQQRARKRAPSACTCGAPGTERPAHPYRSTRVNTITGKRPLDNNRDLPKIRSQWSRMDNPCNHNRTEMIARRDGIDYLRCVECDQVFEAEDLETVSVYDDE